MNKARSGWLRSAPVDLRIYLRISKEKPAKSGVTTVKRRTNACVNTFISVCFN